MLDVPERLVELLLLPPPPKTEEAGEKMGEVEPVEEVAVAF